MLVDGESEEAGELESWRLLWWGPRHPFLCRELQSGYQFDKILRLIFFAFLYLKLSMANQAWHV